METREARRRVLLRKKGYGRAVAEQNLVNARSELLHTCRRLPMTSRCHPHGPIGYLHT